MSKGRYINYGCGFSAPSEWINYDSSPTLRIQKIPLVGRIIVKRFRFIFPTNVRYGDIIKGLPEKDNSCDGVFCSHVLEHLSLQDFYIALDNTYKILRPGGLFRCILPDLENETRLYIQNLNNGDKEACIKFMNATMLGKNKRPKTIKELIISYIGNSNHLWMWDFSSLSLALEQVGFKNIRFCRFNDSKDEMFNHVEEKKRFAKAVAIECQK